MVCYMQEIRSSSEVRGHGFKKLELWPTKESSCSDNNRVAAESAAPVQAIAFDSTN